MSVSKQQQQQQRQPVQAETNRSIVLDKIHATRQEDVIAITEPIPDELGNVSSKTPIFHLPVYKLSLAEAAQQPDGRQVEFHCDLADLTDLISKLKQLN